MIWAVDKQGTKVPLDPSAPVFLLLSQNPENGMIPVERAEMEVSMVDHNRVCEARPRKPGRTPPDRPDRPASPTDLHRLKTHFGG